MTNDEEKPQRGRPSKLTPELIEEAKKYLSGGNYREVVARRVGVAPDTFSHWMTRGEREPLGLYGEFRRAVLETEQDAEMLAVARILAAAANDPKHAQWWLERKFPVRWGRRDRLDLDGSMRLTVEVMAEVGKNLGNLMRRLAKYVPEDRRDAFFTEADKGLENVLANTVSGGDEQASPGA